MKKGDTFEHKGISYTVDKVLSNGKVKAKTEDESVGPKVLVIHPDKIAP